jgi:hypothetical protein
MGIAWSIAKVFTADFMGSMVVAEFLRPALPGKPLV